MDTLFDLMRWMAATVHSLDYKNEYYQALLQLDTAKELLREVGRALISLFG